ncbi:N-acyl homoserine lactonase family protein [Tepidamorphus sp. 3E244]|uniref:N-acyl homoserine lactonase family protein n=1 Tax=Tepidamorphus sp. 3E244 TaxID=3385498 RepID=UPI0038FC086C
MHFLDGGRLRMRRKIFVPGAEKDESIELPVISTLFRHGRGNVLFDTGCHPSVNTDAEARWGGMAKFMTPIAPPKQDVIHALDEVGLKPEDIDIVINSHLHPDHCGCNEFFTRAQFFCHADEVVAANADGAQKMGYMKAEWEHPMRLDTIHDSLDVMGDGRLVTVNLPGHTPGQIGLHAELERDGTFFIVSDAVALERNLDNDEAPLNAWNADRLLGTYETIRARRDKGATIICGHDDEQWQRLQTGQHAYA